MYRETNSSKMKVLRLKSKLNHLESFQVVTTEYTKGNLFNYYLIPIKIQDLIQVEWVNFNDINEILGNLKMYKEELSGGVSIRWGNCIRSIGITNEHKVYIEDNHLIFTDFIPEDIGELHWSFTNKDYISNACSRPNEVQCSKIGNFNKIGFILYLIQKLYT